MSSAVGRDCKLSMCPISSHALDTQIHPVAGPTTRLFCHCPSHYAHPRYCLNRRILHVLYVSVVTLGVRLNSFKSTNLHA